MKNIKLSKSIISIISILSVLAFIFLWISFVWLPSPLWLKSWVENIFTDDTMKAFVFFDYYGVVSK